jgi:hypothetical protein
VGSNPKTARIEVELGEFGWERLTAEAERQNVAIEDLAMHAIMYYLSDLDAGRVAREVPLLRSDEPLDAPKKAGAPERRRFERRGRG